MYSQTHGCVLYVFHEESPFISYLVQPSLSSRADASNIFQLQIKMEVLLEKIRDVHSSVYENGVMSC